MWIVHKNIGEELIDKPRGDKVRGNDLRHGQQLHDIEPESYAAPSKYLYHRNRSRRAWTLFMALWLIGFCAGLIGAAWGGWQAH